ncbi:hypothetical protein HYV50_03470 [Candidatus Pacearchaeota archaeon]|nr:hypothetical protein [Candidatus Pacearchaeota archaeon]
MESSKKERLEEMLRAIQDIKSQNDGLVGTKDIWDMIKEHRNIREVPEKLAEEINKEIKKTFSGVTYEATPQRIYGLFYGIYLPEEEQVEGLYEYEILAKNGAVRFGRDYISFLDPEESEFRRAFNYFLPFFLEANLENITSDEEIGSVIAEIFRREYDEVRHKIDEDIQYKLDDYVQKIFREMSVTDWKEKMCRKSQIQSESFHTRIIIEDAFLIRNMVERVKKEQAEHKLEYRRGILSHVISHLRYSDLLGIPKTWETLVAKYNMIVKNLRKKTEDLIKFREGRDVPEDSSAVRDYKSYVERSKKLGYEPQSLDKRIEDNRLFLDMNIFVRRLLGQEKNWLNKILRN